MDAVVTVVDATNIGRQLTAHRGHSAINEAQEQIAFADVVICNKARLWLSLGWQCKRKGLVMLRHEGNLYGLMLPDIHHVLVLE